MQIEEIALLNTTLMRYDGAKVVYPNPKMNADMVVNLNRSGNRNESIKVIMLYLPQGLAMAVGRSCLPHSNHMAASLKPAAAEAPGWRQTS